MTKEIHQQYIKVFPSKNSRYGALKLGYALVGESDWYETQWNQLDKIVDIPFLILWGTKDPFIKMNYLEKWKSRLKNYQLVLLESGHFVQEEKTDDVTNQIQQFLNED